MRDYLIPERYANLVLQNKDFSGYYVYVEGDSDLGVFRRFLNKDENKVRIESMGGKGKLIEVFDILEARNFQRKIAIRDADYLRISGHSLYEEDYDKDIFLTDYHDLDAMIFNSDALYDFLLTIFSKEKLTKFESLHNDSLVNMINELAYPLACLRLANKRFDLGLSFKPKGKKDNLLKFNKFIDEKKFIYLGDRKLIDTVYGYSQGRGRDIKNKQEISSKFDEVKKEQHLHGEMVNGHDVCRLVSILIRYGLGTSSAILYMPEVVEKSLGLIYCYEYFSKTALYSKLAEWQNNADFELIKYA